MHAQRCVDRAGHDDIVNLLLRRFHRLHVDQCNKLGFTALMKAAIQGRTRCAKLLLFAGLYITLYYSDSDSLIAWLIVTYGCVSWTLKKHTTDNIQAFEMWCYRRALRIPYVDHVSNEEVLEWVNQPRLLLGKIRSQKLRYFGHSARHSSPQNNIALGYMPGTRRQGGQRTQWVNDITDWAGLSLPEVVTLARERWQYRQIVHKVAKAPHGV